MHRVFSALTIACAVFFGSMELAHATSVRIRILKAQEQVPVAGMGLVFQTESQTVRLNPSKSGVSAGLTGLFSSVILTPELRAGVVLWTLVERATGKTLYRFAGSKIQIKGEMIRVGVTPAPNQIEVSVSQPRKTIRADVIATMDLDDYLVGVLPHEMSPDWPLEALKAQAVASRTYALNRIKMRERQGKAYHVESTVMDQVFNWREPTEASERKLKAVRQAVRETKGEVLEDGSGHVVAAYFHADCGGRTEEPSQVWGSNESKLGTAVDVSCPHTPSAKWSWAVDPAEVYARLRMELKLPAQGSVRELSIQKVSESGRVAKLAMTLESGEQRLVSGNALRAGLGFDKLKSTKFELSKAPNGQFLFAGRGHGHGAGLCQWGSKSLAASGANYRKILAHYYPRAKLNLTN